MKLPRLLPSSTITALLLCAALPRRALGSEAASSSAASPSLLRFRDSPPSVADAVLALAVASDAASDGGYRVASAGFDVRGARVPPLGPGRDEFDAAPPPAPAAAGGVPSSGTPPEGSGPEGGGGAEALEEEDLEASRAVLFPWFAEALGLVVFYLTTRYVLVVPYTGIMFVLGMVMGVGATRLGLRDHLTESLAMWGGIDYEVLLLVFLPGLIFSDSFGSDVHLFGAAFWQCVLYAFPMVLAGTCLTALVGYYVFPYSWSFNLAMTFGSILSATDPVAVSALLEEVGAPPRLKIHISGESLLNDGSAMVFYTIFNALFLSEMGIAGVGESIDVAQGFKLFFQMAFGGAAVGMAFALALVSILYLLNRRLTNAEAVVQVCGTVTAAYLCYYTADSVCHTSGVIATLTLGLLTKAFGGAMINDDEKMGAFWELLDQLLNTLLFALGGLVFGDVIANHGEREGFWTGTDWGYLILLWVLLHVIRFACVYSFYPLISRIGLSTNWRESFFLSYGGLRGAVGISLAIALDNSVWSVTEDEVYRKFTTQLFGMIGGMFGNITAWELFSCQLTIYFQYFIGTAFLTLIMFNISCFWCAQIINGSTAGPLLQKLGLAKSTETREKVLQEIFKKDYAESAAEDLVDLLSDKRFARVDFNHVRHHLIFLESEEDLVNRLKTKVSEAGLECENQNLGSLLACLGSTRRVNNGTDGSDTAGTNQGEDLIGEECATSEVDANILEELRVTFIEQLKWAYRKQFRNGELDGRNAFLSYVIQQGLDFAADDVSNGKPVEDWQTSRVVSDKSIHIAENGFKRLYTLNGLLCKNKLGDKRVASGEFSIIRFTVKLCMALIEAHRIAEDQFEKRFLRKYPAEASKVIGESRAQVLMARESVVEIDVKDVEVVTEHVLCTILLNKRSKYLEDLLTAGLLSEKEVQKQLDLIEKKLDAIHRCSEFELSTTVETL
ncbi:hypothetical protein ACHAWF_014765 [Thalassiosira exigua]